MTTRSCRKPLVCSTILALFLLICTTPATAQLLQQDAAQIEANTPPWLQTPRTDPTAPLPEVRQAVTTNLETRGAVVNEEADWLSAPVQQASYASQANVQPIAPPAKGFKVGSVSVVPYGILWADMIYSSSRTFPGSFILWIESADTQGENTFVLDARRSRVGVDVKGPEVDVFGGIAGGGKVEVDFLGGFVNENTTDVRLRHVYWEAKNEDWRFLAGQTWDVVSPLLPSTVNFSVSWCSGNIGFRRTQFRVERYLHLSDDCVIALQGALAQNITPDLASGALAAGVNREGGNWPMIQARTGFTFGGSGLLQHPVTIGLSGNIGETGFDFLTVSPGPLRIPPQDDARFREWSVNADFTVPVSDCLGVHGEFFTGSNLSNLLGGISQGVCPCERVPIRATGGWVEIWYDLNSCVTTHFGFGVDDPNNGDSLIGRTYNRNIYANVFVQLTDNLRTGLEVASWKTLYHNTTLQEPDPADRISFPTAPGEAVVLDWTVQYRF